MAGELGGAGRAGGGFGPPPGSSSAPGRRRPASYLPPGGLSGGAISYAPTAPATSPAGPARVGELVAPGARTVETAGIAAPGRTSYGGTGSRRASVLPSRPTMLNAHKPGIIGLRPLSVGDLLDAAAKHVRRTPGPSLLAALLTVAVGLIPSAVVAGLVASGSWYSALDLGSVLSPSEATFGLLVVGMAWAATVLSGVLSVSVSEAVLGQTASAATMWSMVRKRLGRLTILAFVIIVFAVVPPSLLLLLLVAVSALPTLVVVLVGLASVLVALAWLVVVGWSTATAAPALVLERLGLRAALRRGLRLRRRGLARMAGTFVVVGLVAGLVFAVVDLVVYVIVQLGAELAGLSGGLGQVVALVGANLSTLVAATLVTPFVASAVALVYVDARMRLEGFDLVLQRAAAGASGRLEVGG